MPLPLGLSYRRALLDAELERLAAASRRRSAACGAGCG